MFDCFSTCCCCSQTANDIGKAVYRNLPIDIECHDNCPQESVEAEHSHKLYASAFPVVACHQHCVVDVNDVIVVYVSIRVS